MTRRTFDLLFLSAVVLLGASLRLQGIGEPSLWLDEILHYDIATQAARQPWWHWLGIFQIENGPLFYGSELAGRAMGSIETSARIAPAIFGIAAIVAAWFAGRSIRIHPTAPYGFALLTALSPIEIYYSREARPYALVLLLTTLLLTAILRARLIPVVALLLIAVYSTAVMESVAISVAVVAGIVSFAGSRRFWSSVAAAAAAAAIVIVVAYHPIENIGANEFPRLNFAFFRAILESFSVVALDTSRVHRSAWVFLALAVIGAVDLACRRRSDAPILILMALLPLIIGITGIREMHHFFAVRYVISALPAYLLLVAIGVAAIVEWIPRTDIATAAAICVAAVLVAQGWDAAREEPYRKLNWRTIARTLAAHAHANDAVIEANGWTAVCLEFYLRGNPLHLRFYDVRESPMMGSVFAYQNTTSWIVSSNAHQEFNNWACRFPTVLASPLEDFRLHYSPSLYYFLTDRSSDAERRALVASFPGPPALHFGPGDEPFLNEEWGDAEAEEGRSARWVVGTEARIALPLGAPADRTITLELSSLAHQMLVSVNDRLVGSIALHGERSRYAVDAPAPVWRDGMNVLTLTFDRAVVPAEIDPHSSDRRPLAARFYEVSLAGPQPPENGAHLVRLNEGGPLLDGSAHDRLLPDYVDAQRLTQFTARLGFDPQRALTDLLDDRVTLADLSAASLAADSVCLDDRQFLEQMFRGLLNREISPRELAAFEERLRQKTSREKIVRDLANSDEIRRQVLGIRR